MCTTLFWNNFKTFHFIWIWWFDTYVRFSQNWWGLLIFLLDAILLFLNDSHRSWPLFRRRNRLIYVPVKSRIRCCFPYRRDHLFWANLLDKLDIFCTCLFRTRFLSFWGNLVWRGIREDTLWLLPAPQIVLVANHFFAKTRTQALAFLRVYLGEAVFLGRRRLLVPTLRVISLLRKLTKVLALILIHVRHRLRSANRVLTSNSR